ncbi:MAG TPA: acetoacetyl-CoA reductase [Magnetospirillum sp.]|nr:acetoacetyl-CoA reductase [Magnetospirillum sp.]
MSRVALVTGGTRGIGKAISLALKQAGYRVAANYFGNVEAARSFTEETGIPAYRFDVSNFAECEGGLAQVTNDLGPIEIVVNNAGITRDAPVHKMSYAYWEQVMHTNLTACFNVSRLVIESMRSRGFGRIVNISSLNGQTGQFGQANYSAAKAGLLGLTKALAQEGAPKGITVNSICPGYVDTEMVQAVPPEVLKKIVDKIPVGRLGRAEEIARGVLFLVADDAGFVTGSTLSINGGHCMS